MTGPPEDRTVCLQCGATLGWDRCKLTCRRCGYFESCSDGGDTTASRGTPPGEPRRP